MCLNPACSDHSTSSPLSSSLCLALFFPFLCIPGVLCFCVSGALFFSRGCVCCYFSPSLPFFSLFLSCVFLSLSWSLCSYFYLFQCVCLRFSVCLFLYVSLLSLSPLSPSPPFSVSLYLCAFLTLTFSPPACPLLPEPGLPPPPPVQGNVCGAIVLGDI